MRPLRALAALSSLSAVLAGLVISTIVLVSLMGGDTLGPPVAMVVGLFAGSVVFVLAHRGVVRFILPWLLRRFGIA